MTIRTAAPALVAGGLITTAGGVARQIAEGSDSVSEDLFRYPWSSGAFVAIALVGAVAFALMSGGLAQLRASAPPGGARTGLVVAAAGMAVVGIAQLASIAARNEPEDAGIALAVIVGFGIGTVLVAGSLIVAGRAGIRAGWEGRVPRALLAAGIWAICLMVLVATPLSGLADVVSGLLIAAAGLPAGAPRPEGARSIALR